jgi:hypothetical protein
MCSISIVFGILNVIPAQADDFDNTLIDYRILKFKPQTGGETIWDQANNKCKEESPIPIKGDFELEFYFLSKKGKKLQVLCEYYLSARKET